MRADSILLPVVFSVLLFTHAAAGQEIAPGSQQQVNRSADSLTVSRLLAEADKYLAEGKTDSSVAVAKRAIEIAVRSGLIFAEASGYELLGNVYGSLPEWEEMLFNYLKAAELYNRSRLSLDEARVYRLIAGRYFDSRLYKMSASYFEREFALYQGDALSGLAVSAESAALSWLKAQDDTMSLKWYLAAYHYYDGIKDLKSAMRCSQNIALLFTRLGRFREAMEEYQKQIRVYTSENDFDNTALTHNNLGYLKFMLKDHTGAVEEFVKAADNSGKGSGDSTFLSDVYTNIGISYQSLGQQKEMMESFLTALDLARKAERNEMVARIDHILALIYFNEKDFYHAEVYCRECIESAKKSSDHVILQECYRTYSQVMEQGNDFINALDYYEKYLSVRDSVNFEIRIREQVELDRQQSYEELEQRLRLDIADQEIRDLALKNLLAESARRENEFKLLQKQQELDKSEKERLSQSLALERERYVLNLRNQEVRSLQQQQRIDSLQLKQKEDEALALDRQNKLLESEKRQQEITIQKEKQVKRLALGIGVLMVIVAVMILAGLISTRRKNQKLAESKRKIELINADLEIKNEEIIRQKDIIEQKNQSITDSIQYASRIQAAVLPPIDFISDWGIENFILYRPKDIVSGDFYWGKRKGDKIIVAAADCTGHGVPGAFMSMLGHAFLDEILNTREVDNAAMILDLLRDEVINTLRQRGMVGEARDGMDISLCMIDTKTGKLDFAGANNPMYLIRERKLIKAQADRMPIGIHVTTISPFTNNSMEIKKGDYIYLFSDGYADQFGGPRGKKFMYKPFQDLLLRIHAMPMDKQREILDATFTEWMGSRDQVDDVLVIGMHL